MSCRHTWYTVTDWRSQYTRKTIYLFLFEIQCIYSMYFELLKMQTLVIRYLKVKRLICYFSLERNNKNFKHQSSLQNQSFTGTSITSKTPIISRNISHLQRYQHSPKSLIIYKNINHLHKYQLSQKHQSSPKASVIFINTLLRLVWVDGP